MTVLSQRAVRVVIGTEASAKVIEGLRVQFRVKKTVSKEPNECELSITNLAEQSRAALQAQGTKVVVEAGYEGELSQLFSGDSRFISHVREGANWVTKVQMGDGERAYRYAQVSESFRAGTSVATVFAKVAQQLALDIADAVAFVRSNTTEQFTHGYAASGKASKEIDRLLSGRGFEWSIQDGKLQVTKAGKAVVGSAALLSPTTGLVGSPAYGSPENSKDHVPFEGSTPKRDKKGQILKAKSLLQPSIKPGGKVRLDSASVKGIFRVQTVVHTGDTAGQDWYTELDLLPSS
jgi:hypothetical protein